MVEREERARLRGEEHREEFAVRREERDMAAMERQLASEMKAFEDAEADTERQIEEEWRKERFGHELDRPPAWKRPTR